MEDDWNVDYSDDEYKTIKGPWEPPSEMIERLYNILDSGEIPELNWKSVNYKLPSPEPQEKPKEENKEKQIEDKSDFDFLDEMTSPKLKIRNKGEESSLKGSAKKKTTSLDGVINNMRRHNLIPAQGSVQSR